jgi:hypothetical protein
MSLVRPLLLSQHLLKKCKKKSPLINGSVLKIPLNEHCIIFKIASVVGIFPSFEPQYYVSKDMKEL